MSKPEPYPSEQLLNQVWMSEFLRVLLLNDRDSEPAESVTDDKSTVSRIRSLVNRGTKISGNSLANELAALDSLRACKDASLSGTQHTKLLAVCKLAEFGSEAFDSLQIMLIDENEIVRSLAIGMMAFLGDKNFAIEVGKGLEDPSEMVIHIAEYALYWLENQGIDNAQIVEPERAIAREQTPKEFLDLLETPLQTSDSILVANSHTSSQKGLTFKLSVTNETQLSLMDVKVRILAYPSESLSLDSDTEHTLKRLRPGVSKIIPFGFTKIRECIEGEIITSVVFTESNGERVSAKAGNWLIKSLYEQLKPVKTTPDKFRLEKQKMRYWNREHNLEKEPKELYEMLLDISKKLNLRVFRSESIERDDSFMGVIAAMGEGRYTGTRVSVTQTVVGRINDGLSKLRIDIYSDDPEVLQIAASELFVYVRDVVHANE
ncbi:MAG: hypothetical protein ACXABF_07340 [Candidatus Thorarchaeota archaeon]